jgi:hypothetical protein
MHRKLTCINGPKRIYTQTFSNILKEKSAVPREESVKITVFWDITPHLP